MPYPTVEAAKAPPILFKETPRFVYPHAPAGFTVSAEARDAYIANGEIFPEGLWDQIGSAVAISERFCARRFGDFLAPLLLTMDAGQDGSAGTGAVVIKNLGLNDRAVSGLIAAGHDAHTVYDAYRRLLQKFGRVVMDVPNDLFEAVMHHAERMQEVERDSFSAETLRIITYQFKNAIHSYTGDVFPHDPFDQLYMAIEAIFLRPVADAAVADPLLTVNPVVMRNPLFA